jgi:hypothetical protein
VQEKVENPAFVMWNEKDRQLMSYLLGSISREVLVQLTEHHTPSSLEGNPGYVCFTLACADLKSAASPRRSKEEGDDNNCLHWQTDSCEAGSSVSKFYHLS